MSLRARYSNVVSPPAVISPTILLHILPLLPLLHLLPLPPTTPTAYYPYCLLPLLQVYLPAVVYGNGEEEVEDVMGEEEVVEVDEDEVEVGAAVVLHGTPGMQAGMTRVHEVMLLLPCVEVV